MGPEARATADFRSRQIKFSYPIKITLLDLIRGEVLTEKMDELEWNHEMGKCELDKAAANRKWVKYTYMIFLYFVSQKIILAHKATATPMEISTRRNQSFKIVYGKNKMFCGKN